MATERAKKTCDMCGKVIAIKHGLFYHTRDAYVTIREDVEDLFETSLTGTQRRKRFYCLGCWDDIVWQARKARGGNGN